MLEKNNVIIRPNQKELKNHCLNLVFIFDANLQFLWKNLSVNNTDYYPHLYSF